MIGEVSSFINTGYGTPLTVSYVLKKEHWGNGYATEFARVLVEYLWSLPRKDITTKILPSDLHMANQGKIAEQISTKGKSHYGYNKEKLIGISTLLLGWIFSG